MPLELLQTTLGVPWDFTLNYQMSYILIKHYLYLLITKAKKKKIT